MLHRVGPRIRYDSEHLPVHRIKGQQEHNPQEKEKVQCNESKDIVDGFAFQGLTLEFCLGNITGADQLPDVDVGTLQGNDDSGHLDAAGSGARHGTGKHHKNQGHSGQHGPDMIVGSGKARRSDEGNHLEQRMPECLFRSVILGECLKTSHQADKHAANRQSNDQEITLKFLASQYIPQLAHQNQIIQAEVAAKEDQEHRHHILGERMQHFHTARKEAEAAGTGAAEGSQNTEE